MALRRRSGRDWFCRRSRAHSGSCWRGFCCPGRSAPLSSSGNVEIGTDSPRDLERFPHGRSRWERGPRWEAASGVYSCYGVGGGRVPEGITLGSEIANHNSRVAKKGRCMPAKIHVVKTVFLVLCLGLSVLQSGCSSTGGGGTTQAPANNSNALHLA